MSFSINIKREICKLPIKDKCCALAELLGIICFGASIRGNSLVVKVSNSTVVKRIEYLTEFTFGFKAAVEKIQKKRGYTYIVEIASNENLSIVLETLHLIKNSHDMKDFVSFDINDELVENECCMSALLRGAFVISGSCTKPDTRYHLELSSSHRKAIKKLSTICEEFELKPKVILRNGNYIFYLKNSEQICDFLARIGSVKSLLEFHSVKVMKEFSNNMNRAVNCEIANKEKTRNAADLQIEAILKIDRIIGIDNIDENLREVAIVRYENPDMNLSELGAILSTPLSKSGVNHRLRKLSELAERLRVN